MDFSLAANFNFINFVIRDISHQSGVLTIFRSYSFRAGGLRDLAHIPAQEILGVANPAITKAPGHSLKSLHSGLADDYVGPLNQDLTQLKDKATYKDYQAPKFGAPRIAKSTRQEMATAITAACTAANLDLSDKKARTRIRLRLRKGDLLKQLDESIASPRPGILSFSSTLLSSALLKRQLLAPTTVPDQKRPFRKRARKSAAPLEQWAPSKINVQQPFVQLPIDSGDPSLPFSILEESVLSEQLPHERPSDSNEYLFQYPSPDEDYGWT